MRNIHSHKKAERERTRDGREQMERERSSDGEKDQRGKNGRRLRME